MDSKKLNKLVLAKFNSLATYKAHQQDGDLADALKLVPFDVNLLQSLGVEVDISSTGGYVKFGPLFKGLILQWGSGTENRTVNFPVEFPSALVSLVATSSTRDGRAYGLATINRTNASFSVEIGPDEVGSCEFNWIAVGY